MITVISNRGAHEAYNFVVSFAFYSDLFICCPVSSAHRLARERRCAPLNLHRFLVHLFVVHRDQTDSA